MASDSRGAGWLCRGPGVEMRCACGVQGLQMELGAGLSQVLMLEYLLGS